MIDATLPWLADPYRYVARRCAALGADMIETRLLLRPIICMRGAEAARLFYDPEHFDRRKAMPRPEGRTPIGAGEIQGLDGALDQSRKAIFLPAIERGPATALPAAFLAEWSRAVAGWAGAPVRLYPAFQLMLARVACAWAGVPLGEEELGLRARQLGEAFDHAGAKGPARPGFRLSRRAAESWIAGLVRRARRGESIFAPESLAERLALRRDPAGALVEPGFAAVEILNLLRPVVAVSVYMVFVAHALALHPAWRAHLAAGEARLVRAFVEEVRRFYPFSPALSAQVRDDFEWRGAHFSKGRRVLLDLYATNHHPDWWEEPESFRPERFLGLAPNPWSFIPQGGGLASGQGCPGERITLSLMEAAVTALARRTRYQLPVQKLELDMRSMPALPKSRMVIAGARLA